MKHTCGRTWTMPALLSLLLVSSSCGLGTEIGNGVKEDGHGSGSSKKVDKSDTSPEVAQNDTVGAGKKPTEEEAANTDTADKPVPADAASGAVGSEINLGQLLTVSCASPFATPLFSPLSLDRIEAQKATPVLNADFVAGEWRINTDLSKDGNVDIVVTSNPVASPHAITVSDAHGQPIAAVYTCGKVIDEPIAATGNQVEQSKSTVVLTSIATGNKTTLVWFTQVHDDAAEQDLVRVEITPPDAKAPTIFAPPPP